MTPFECYKEYVAIKSHFMQTSYDYFKYQGKMKVKIETFEKRNDKVFFQKLAKHSDLHNFLLANLSTNNKAWIKDLAYSNDAERVYKDWLKRQQSITYTFQQDLEKLDTDFNKNFIINENEHPILFKKFLSKEITLETFCLLIELSGCLKYWNKKMQYDLIWDEMKIKIIKYLPFIDCDKEKIKKITLDFFS